MKTLVKSSGIAIGVVAISMLLVLFACKKEKINLIDQLQSTEKSGTVSPCGIPVIVDLIAGQNSDAGSVEIMNDETNLYVTFHTDGNWVMGATHLYVGSYSAMPKTPTGNPKIGNFPYKHTLNPKTNTDTYTIPLSQLGTCFIVAAHADLYETDGNGTVVQTQTGWANGTQMNTSGSWAMYVDYCVQECNPCVYDTVSYNLFGGQTIPVGELLVTNDETNLYVTYSTAGSWYIGAIHLYVGSISGLPVNNSNTPVPGQFPYSETYNPYTQTATITVPLSGFPACYEIAAHAEVHKIENGQEVQSETAWSFGNPFQNTNRWGWTSSYCTQVCE